MPFGLGELGSLGEAIGKAIAHLQSKQEPKYASPAEYSVEQKPMPQPQEMQHPEGSHGWSFPHRSPEEEDEEFQRSVEDYRNQRLGAKYDMVQSKAADMQNKSMSPEDWARIQAQRNAPNQ